MTQERRVAGILTGQGWTWSAIAEGGALHLTPPRAQDRSTTACFRPLAGGAQLGAFDDGERCVRCLETNGGRA